ncbi:1,3-beta-glucanase [Brenneria alni]|uniref:Endoglucanase n=1 Tax=Brenneria alni TaxID=71656 RepID=A0A421DRC5_9GAMM|nr:cellulase family glycosylhydrolase [Brenneria alni]RLM26555.1 1,3-beta-glucanase [Brenneria alni]
MWIKIVRTLKLGVASAALAGTLSFSASCSAATPVQIHGQLSIANGRLVGMSGEPVQLKGMSSHGLQWYGDYVNQDVMKWLRDDWGISVFRAAMYTAEGGYIDNPSVANKVKEAVAAAQSLGVYIIIDWHILSDGNPNTYKTEAKDFFSDMAGLYGSSPNVIYEIANEPNGNVTWNEHIRPYALEVTQTIREKDPDNIIIVGTGTWSQDVHDAADNPLPDANTMYALHFYAGTHGQFLRDRIDYAQSLGAPIFVSEWGTSGASGSDGPFLPESQTWIDFLNNHGISWVNWSLADKSEASAALAPGASTSGGWTEAELSASGKFVRELIRADLDTDGGDDETTPTEPENPGREAETLVLQYRNGNSNSFDNAINLAFNIQNTGSTVIKLSDLKVRYYFNDDGKSTDQIYIDWANVGASNITATSEALSGSTTQTNRYVELSFSSGAGSIPAGGQSGEVQVRIHPLDWSNYDETNDYSYDSSITTFTNWDKMTVHDKGSLVWGIEP